MPNIDAATVQAGLTVPEVLKAYGFEPIAASGSPRYNDCPACGDGKRGKFKATDEVCFCHSCGFKGNIFAVVGSILDLDTKTHFVRILNTCAALAGIEGDYDTEHFKQKIEDRRARQKYEAAERAETRRRAELGAREVWDGLPTHSYKGKQYLAGRCIMPDQAGKDCRYGSHSVCLPLWRDGELVNVVGRRFVDGSPKIRGMNGCGTRGHFGRAKLMRSHQGPIVITEGFFDYLSALEMRPNRLVLGAHGCNNLPYIAEVAAGLIKADESRGLVLIVHQDDAGRESMAKAREAAIAAGVSDAAITVWDVPEGNDLNDYLCRNGGCAW